MPKPARSEGVASVEKRLCNVVFNRFPKPDGTVIFKSSEPGRKVAELEPGTTEPASGTAYEVMIVQDTNPSDPNKGKFIVRILREDLDVPLVMKRKDTKPALPEKISAIQDSPDGSHVLILETELPIDAEGGPLVPRTEDFRHFALDSRTLMTLEKIAAAVELRQPCLLEGETATSKTSSIEYLAMRTNTPRIRLNLNGQTDTSELIGKYVPNDGQLAIEFEEALRENGDSLPPKLKTKLENARKEGRGLTLLECQELSKALDLKIPEWRWQDGKIPLAMKKGYWLILDEINLAEPQILERLNSLLERAPSLVVSEHEGEVIGPGGMHDTHERFRIFATENPASYAGRKAMSPAFKNRWSAYQYVEVPSEAEYAAMMNLMVYGEQPGAKVGGVDYDGEMVEPLYNLCGKVEGMRGFITKLAKFHASLEKMARERTIGKGRVEPYVFTRRDLMAFLTYLEEKTLIDRRADTRVTVSDDPKKIILRALKHVYMDQVGGADDIKKVTDLLDQIGISEGNWTHEFPATRKQELSKVKVGDVFLGAKSGGMDPVRGLIIDLGNGIEALMSSEDVIEFGQLGKLHPGKTVPVRIVEISQDGDIRVVPNKERSAPRLNEVFERARVLSVGDHVAELDLYGGAKATLTLVGEHSVNHLRVKSLKELMRVGEIARVRVIRSDAEGVGVVLDLVTPDARRRRPEDVKDGEVFKLAKVIEVGRDSAIVDLGEGLGATLLLSDFKAHDPNIQTDDLRELFEANDSLNDVRVIDKHSDGRLFVVFDKPSGGPSGSAEVTVRKPEDIKVGEVFERAQVILADDRQATVDLGDGLEATLILKKHVIPGLDVIVPSRPLNSGDSVRVRATGSSILESGKKIPVVVLVEDPGLEAISVEIKVGEVIENAKVTDVHMSVALLDLGGGKIGSLSLTDLHAAQPDLVGLKDLRDVLSIGQTASARVLAEKSAGTLSVVLEKVTAPRTLEDVKVGEVFRRARVTEVNHDSASLDLGGGFKATMLLNDLKSLAPDLEVNDLMDLLKSGDVLASVRVAYKHLDGRIFVVFETLLDGSAEKSEATTRTPERVKVGEIFREAVVRGVGDDMAVVNLGPGLTGEIYLGKLRTDPAHKGLKSLLEILKPGEKIDVEVTENEFGILVVKPLEKSGKEARKPEDIKVGEVFKNAKIRVLGDDIAIVDICPGAEGTLDLSGAILNPFSAPKSLLRIFTLDQEINVRVKENNLGSIKLEQVVVGRDGAIENPSKKRF